MFKYKVGILHINDTMIELCIYTPKGQADRPIRLNRQEFEAIKKAILEDEDK